MSLGSPCIEGVCHLRCTAGRGLRLVASSIRVGPGSGILYGGQRLWRPARCRGSGGTLIANSCLGGYQGDERHAILTGPLVAARFPPRRHSRKVGPCQSWARLCCARWWPGVSEQYSTAKTKQTKQSVARRRTNGGQVAVVRPMHPGVPRSIAAVGPAPVFEPTTRRATLRYVEAITLTGTSGALGNHVFSANGLYDPNITGTGHQPMGFDQLIALYARGYVVSSRIKVEAYQTTGVPSVIGIILTTASSAPYSNFYALLESGLAAYKLAAGDTTDTQTVSRTLNVEQYFSLENVLEEAEYFSTSGGNPTRQAYYHVFNQDQNSTSTSIFQLVVTIDYDVIFTTPVLQTPS
jgi:hypothetical protein